MPKAQSKSKHGQKATVGQQSEASIREDQAHPQGEGVLLKSRSKDSKGPLLPSKAAKSQTNPSKGSHKKLSGDGPPQAKVLRVSSVEPVRGLSLTPDQMSLQDYQMSVETSDK